MPDALMLLSGGLDSVTALTWARQEGIAIIGALSFDYGQRHAREVEAAAAVAAHYGVPHQIIALAPIRGSRLTDTGDIPQGRDLTALSEADPSPRHRAGVHYRPAAHHR